MWGRRKECEEEKVRGETTRTSVSAGLPPMATSLAASARLTTTAGEVHGSVRPCCPGRLAVSFPSTGCQHPAAGVRCGGGADAEEGGRFVGSFREAWTYIRGHRGSTFVVVISGEVVAGLHLHLNGILQASQQRRN